MYNYNYENKHHKFIGFWRVDGETKPVYFDKEKRRYKVMQSNIRKIKDKATKEEILILNGIDWRFLDESEIKLIEDM